MKLPYVYKLTDLETGKFYIGSKTAKRGCCTLLGVKYFTSSKYVEPLFRANPDRFLIEIILEHEDADYIIDVESNLLKLYDARNNPDFYNCTNGDSKFNAKKCALLLWGNDAHRTRMSEVQKELYKTVNRKEQLRYASSCITDETRKVQSETHKKLAETPARREQLSKAWEAGHTPEAKKKRSESMKALAAGGGLKKFQEKGSSAHFEKLKSDPEYAENYSAKLKAGWVKRKSKKGITE